MEAEEKDGAAILSGVIVGKLGSYIEKYQCHVCPDATKLANEVSRREYLLGTFRPGGPASVERGRYLKRVKDWKAQAEAFLTELFTLRRATEIVEQQYFDGLPVLFADEAEGLDQLVTLVQELINDYNDDLASRLEDQQRLLSDSGSEAQVIRFIIDPAGTTEKIEGPVKDRVAYTVDFAKAEALGLIGETEKASQFADRHLPKKARHIRVAS